MIQTAVSAAPPVDVPAVFNVAVEYVDGAVAAGHGAQLAYIHEGEQLTFAELQKRVNQLGNALAALGVEIEQRVAIVLPNRSEFVTAFFGAIKIGALSTPMSFGG
jgi:acyl-coenzyme A synthetase/AMP-(fatty) acid ligase